MNTNSAGCGVIQESSPLRGTYDNALPLGPLMELGARNEQNSFGGLADILLASGREAEGRRMIEEFDRMYPEQRKDLERIRATERIVGASR